MTDDSRERNKWKVRITDCVNQSSDLISQPVAKLMAEVMVGILGSGSLQLSRIGRILMPPTMPQTLICPATGFIS